ncbi:MAG TPA: hypothetical protein PK511_09590 [Chitinophagales bacterium]|nr:hypothetical protein [Cyclobacteriaceae bacterium]HMY35625.1 hypothetical protein [bacterium]HNI54761.1 hypothetical protein [Chitinophagales bacterium]HMY95675.1 hypothetical protein [Cyclobacteriaceae bacterium]HNA14602.1 hypothetical protein [Cyclobacteriaceae bacterium]
MPDQIKIEFIADTTGLKPAVDALESMGAIDKTIADDFRKNNAAISERIKLLDATGDSAEKLAGDFKKVSDAVKVEGGKNAVDELATGLNQATDKSQRLTTQLRAMKQELSRMDQAGQSGTKAFNDLARAAGKLEDQIGDTAKRIRALASDTKNIDGVVGVVSGLAGAFSAAQGAAALFGGENEDLQKALLKVNAAMAIATGVQQVANTLQKESAAAITITTAAQEAYAFVVGTSTGALKIFRIALAATGIGLFAIAIGAVVENFDKIKAKMVELFPILGHFGDVWIGIKAIFFGTIAAFTEGITGVGKAIKLLFSDGFGAAKDALVSIDLKGAFKKEVEATYAEAKAATEKSSDELVKTIKTGGDKVITARKEVAKREQEEIKALPINNPVLAAEDQQLVEKAKTGEAFKGAQERIDIANTEQSEKNALNDIEMATAANLNNFIISLGDNRIAAIEAQAKRGIITEEKAAREIARIKRAQAIASKGEALFNIAISQPQAIAKTLGLLGIAGAAATPIILALMALQIGSVLAQPIPKFAKGTKNAPPGFKLVGEAGPELIYDDGGYPIIPNGDTQKILNKWMPGTPSIPESVLSGMETKGYGIDYTLLAQSLAKEISKLPISETKFDENGVTKFIHTGMSRREIKTKRANF